MGDETGNQMEFFHWAQHEMMFNWSETSLKQILHLNNESSLKIGLN